MRLSAARIALMTAALLAIWGGCALFSLGVGSVTITPADVLRLLRDRMAGQQGSTPAEAILFSVRLPRIFLASLVGAALAVAGAAFQSLLRNPLADPYVLGVSTGASTGTILFSMLAASSGSAAFFQHSLYARPLAAFLGALVTIAIVYLTATGGGRAAEDTPRLLLAGVVLASFISAINVFLLTTTDQADLRGIFYWLIGDLSRPVDASFYAVTFVVVAGSVALYFYSHSLNLISMGEQDALILGIEVARVKIAVYVLASLITGAVVSVGGPIPYIGLICPHIARMLFGSDNRRLMPAVFVFGAVFTLLADMLARTVLSPAELPVGVITAIGGAPLFIYLLRTRGAKG
jgi:iron complex transport system permease protein